MLDLIIYPPDTRVLMRYFLSAALFIPTGCLIAYGFNLETLFPITAVIVHLFQMACSTACTCDFLRKVCPSTFSDLLIGIYCTFFLTAIALAQIGFGSERFSLWIILCIITTFIAIVLSLFFVYTLLNDPLAISLFSERSADRSIFFFVVGSYFFLLIITLGDAGAHYFHLTDLGAFETNLIYWSGVLFAYSVYFCVNVFDGKERIANGKLNELKLLAEANKMK